MALPGVMISLAVPLISVAGYLVFGTVAVWWMLAVVTVGLSMLLILAWRGTYNSWTGSQTDAGAKRK